jgi:hypothetical protein
VGAKEVNRNPMLEALVLNYDSKIEVEPMELGLLQLNLFEK